MAPRPSAPPEPPAQTHPAAPVLTAWRPVLFTAAAGVLVALLVRPAYNPTGPLAEYALRAGVVVLVAAGALAWWWARRSGQRWGADLVPAVVGAITALTVASSLNGTPFAPGGLVGDQTFRTAAITRYADTWLPVDFTFPHLPSFYAPAYFWILGRTADLGGVDPWRMAKVGGVLATLAVPLVTYLLWRRLVADRTAALIAVVPLAVENFYEPYAWLVLFAIVPWWLEVAHGLRRPGRPPGNPWLLGLIGALLFMTYYYFFFITAIALVLHLVVERLHGRWDWRRLRRTAGVLALAAAFSAVYWLPLGISMLTGEHTRSLANRWFAASHPRLPLPMAELSITGVVALMGLIYLVWTVRRDALSRGLLVLLAAAYGWYVLGAAAAVADTPLLSFRGKPLVPLILLIAGVLALVRLTALAARRFHAGDVRRVAWVLGVVVVVVVAQSFVTTVRGSAFTAAAHTSALPDGQLPAYHAEVDTEPHQPIPPAAELRARLDALLTEVGRRPGDAVVLSDRADLLALYPYRGFLQWNAHYAHPAAGFPQRQEFLAQLSDVDEPAEFAAAAGDNPYQPIDAFVLRDAGQEWILSYAADDFPRGIRSETVRFPRELFSEAYFVVSQEGEQVIAVRR